MQISQTSLSRGYNHSTSEVIGIKENSNGDNGVVYVHSIGSNQHGDPVIDYKRWVMVRKKNKNLKKVNPSIPDLNKEVSNKEVISIAENYNFDVSNFDFAASGSALCYEDYNVSEKINHIDGMTVEEAEHMMLSLIHI